MKDYSQSGEQEIILNYFNNKGIEEGNLLSIGENDGLNLSNCLALLEMGWTGVLVEPSSKAFLSLKKRHGGDDNIKYYVSMWQYLIMWGRLPFMKVGNI